MLAKPLGSALPVLLNLLPKLHGDQQKENMAPFEYVLPLTFFASVILSNFWVFLLPNVIWMDPKQGILKPLSDVFLCKQNSQLEVKIR